jgi:alpha-glucosidase
MERVVQELDPRGAWPTWVLSNHDVPRHRTRYGGSEARARSAAVALLTRRGTPFVYAGEELGLEDAVVPPERTVDPGGRDGCRAPLPWTPDGDHGWGGEPWLPFAPDADRLAATVQRDDPTSVLHLYRRLLQARRASPALQQGDQDLLDVPTGALAWRRHHGDDERTVAVNMGTEAVEVALRGTVLVASDGVGEGEPFDGHLEPDRAVLLQP